MSGGLSILIIDDELQIRRFLRISLESSGYQVQEALTAQEGLTLAATKRPDVIILDLGLPDMDGQLVLKRLREWSHVPIIILSARHADAEKIAALDAGADDYLTKPFSVGELMARLRVAQRHTQPIPTSAMYRVAGLTVDLNQRAVSVNGEPVKFTPTEYAFLRLMIQHAGQALTHRQILREVWGKEYIDETHYLRVYVAQIRQKIEADPTRPKLLLTEPGVGYRLELGEWVGTAPDSLPDP